MNYHYLFNFSDYKQSDNLKMIPCAATVLVLMTSITCTMSAAMQWRDQTVLNVVEQNILQLNCDVISVAHSLLNDTTLGSHLLHPKTHPALLDHAGWVRKRDLLRLSLANFEQVLRLPGTSNSTIAKPRPRPKRSFLGLSTAADDARLDERIQALQASSERAAKLTSFISGKLQKSSQLMKSYIQNGEIQKKEASRNLIHLQLEVAVLWWIRAADEAAEELEALTDSVLRG